MTQALFLWLGLFPACICLLFELNLIKDCYKNFGKKFIWLSLFQFEFLNILCDLMFIDWNFTCVFYTVVLHITDIDSQQDGSQGPQWVMVFA